MLFVYNKFMIDPRFKKVLFTREELETKIKELAGWVNETYKDSDNLIIVGLLKGAFPFMAQLIKDVTVDHIIDFMVLSTYDGDVKSSGNFKVVMDLVESITNRDVLIVEDLIDSGLTLTKTMEALKMREPRSVKVLTLLDKPIGRTLGFKPDKFGFEAPDEFLVGFGLDVKGKLRNVPYIGVFDQKKLSEV